MLQIVFIVYYHLMLKVVLQQRINGLPVITRDRAARPLNGANVIIIIIPTRKSAFPCMKINLFPQVQS